MSKKDIIQTLLALSTLFTIPATMKGTKTLMDLLKEKGGTPEAAQQIAEIAGKPSVSDLTQEDIQQVQEQVQEQVQQAPEPPLAPEPAAPEETLPSMTQIIVPLLEHEGLLEAQLPVRITHPVMRRWNTYLGFALDQDESKKPANRRNFLFLRNPADKPAAMAAQFARYNEDPNRFGLPPNPTLEQAIRVFDQENPGGKMRHISGQVDGVDFSRPLADYL
jgi:hypothetical protein